MCELTPEISKTDTARQRKQMRALRAIATINAVMFVVESASGYCARSTAMVSDSLDMLGDALGAGTSALVGKSGARRQAWVALAKAGATALLGLGVLGAAAFLFFNPVMPVVTTMGIVGGAAFAANMTCAALLYRYRNDNLNLRATWKCTRNDILSNVCVLGAAALSHVLLSPLPDIVVGVLVSGLFVKSSFDIAREALGVLQATGKKNAIEAAIAPQSNAPQNAPRFKKGLWGIFNRTSAQKSAAPPAKEVAAPQSPVPFKKAV